MNQDTDDRLRVPASTILILFITLAVITPLATWRMAQQLASPTVEVITLEDGGDRFRGHWKVGEVEYSIEEGVDEPRSTGTFALSVTLPPLAEDPIDRKVTLKRPRDGFIEQVIFLDPDGDGICSATICIRSAGSGSYLQILHYDLSINGVQSEGKWSDLTAIPEHLSVGFIGHDTIERQSEMLVRAFPIHLDGDTNAAPSGETRSLIWDFNSGRWRPDPRK
ncbi:MAG: PliI family lysozyme inhibitor of I-type lysozyme [Planctomycetota bacterium]|jgi:hypothetical protein